MLWRALIQHCRLSGKLPLLQYLRRALYKAYMHFIDSWLDKKSDKPLFEGEARCYLIIKGTTKKDIQTKR